MKQQNWIDRLKVFFQDFGRFSGMASITAVMPSVGSTIMLFGVYQFSPWLREHKEIGVLLFILLMVTFAGFALVATNILGIVSGFAFGFYLGIFAQLCGLLGAATIMYWLAQRLAGESLQSKIDEKPKLKAVHQSLINESFAKTLLVIILIRLSPAMPFAVSNFIMSAAGVRYGTYILGTFLGMLPRAWALVFIGSSLSELDFSYTQQTWIIILGIIATILAIIVIGVFSKRALNNLID